MSVPSGADRLQFACSKAISPLIDNNLARQRIAQNAAYGSAAAALDAYRSLLSKFQFKMMWRSKDGVPRSEIIADLCEDLRVYNHITNSADQEAPVAWILKQQMHSGGD